jgi:glycosyltransferase involved in cell wall biosynthesis
MKLCIVTPEFPPDNWGGLARTAARVARHACRLNMNVHVAHFRVVDDPLILLDENRSTRSENGITVHQIRVNQKKFSEDYRGVGDSPHIRSIKMMYQSLEILYEENRFDLFHSFFLYPAGYVTGLLAKRFGLPSVVTLVGNDVKRHFFQPEAVAMCKSGLDNARMVVALSRELIELADALTPIRGKSAIIYNSICIPSARWRPQHVRTLPFRIGSAGIFKYAKGLPYLLKAVAELAGRHDVTLELVGDIRAYERDTIERMIVSTGTAAMLTIHKPMPHEDIWNWLISLDVFVLSSVSEGCPNILMEAMACGVPSVATRVGAVSKLIEDGISGLVTPYGNAGALANALETLMDMPDKGASLGRHARARMEIFSPDREMQEWRCIYQKIMETKEGASHSIS